MDAVNNLAYSRVVVAPDPADSGLSLDVITGDADAWSVPFNAVVWPQGAIPTKDNAEIVRVVDNSAPTLTIERAQEGTTARSIQAGDQFAATISAALLEQLGGGAQGIQFFNLDSDLIATAVSQGSGSIVGNGGELVVSIAPTSNEFWFVFTAWGNITFGAGTAGEAGQPIEIDLMAILNSLDGITGMNSPPWGPKGSWAGTVAGGTGAGVLVDPANPTVSWLTLCGFGGLIIRDALQENDEIFFNLGALLVGND